VMPPAPRAINSTFKRSMDRAETALLPRHAKCWQPN
jgi:hypothetical protein